jgi:DNA-binding transcriptional LysR family regulator
MQDLNDMAVFASVVQTGSFTAAGKALSLPKSNVSRRIARLEDTLNARLLERTTRKLRLTEIGQSLYHHAQRIVEEAESANSLVDSMTSSPRGILRVSASVFTGQHLLAPILPEFLKLFPEIHLHLELSNRRIDLIEEGIDVAIRIGSMKDSTMISRYLGNIRIYLYCSSDYISILGKPTRPENLIDHRLLLMSDMAAGAGNILRLNGPRGEEKISLTPYCSINDFRTLHHFAREGLGIAALPEYLCRGDLNNESLERVLPTWEIQPVDFHAVYPSRRGAMPKLMVFLDFVKSKFVEIQSK